MRPPIVEIAIALSIAACVPGERANTEPRLEIEPADLTVTVIDGAAVVQPYTATLVEIDGDRRDVTSTVTFHLDREVLGAWESSTLTVSGTGAGRGRVIATDGALSAETDITVYVRGSRYEGTVPPYPDKLFENALESASLAPIVVYPAIGVIVPENLGEMDIHWEGQPALDLYEISLRNEYVDLRVYKNVRLQGFTTFNLAEWTTLASSGEPLQLGVSGLTVANPTFKGTALPRTIDITYGVIDGGLYYWAAGPQQGIYRYDMSTPGVAPEPFFPAGQQPTECIGCHALSRDGTKLALTLDSGDGRGTIYDVAERKVLVPFDTNAQFWNFATFTPDATKLLTVFEGKLALRDVNGGKVIANIATPVGKNATHPELSPDGTQLAYVENSYMEFDFWAFDGSIVTRDFNATTGEAGPIKTLVPHADTAANYYPSWSPDGKWVLFTRTRGNSYSDKSAQLWVVKADGTGVPIFLGHANGAAAGINSWARWAPFVQTHRGQPVFYLTFSSSRPFGVRQLEAEATQIWMAPFFAGRAEANQDPTGQAFRMPFQRLDTSNHIAQWTNAIVIGRKPDGSPLTRAEAIRDARK